MNTPNTQLTDVEVRRLTLFARGLIEKQVAFEEWVSRTSIKQSMLNVRKKLNAKNTYEAIAKGVKNKLCWIIPITHDENISLTKIQEEALEFLTKGTLQKEAPDKVGISDSGFKARSKAAVTKMGAFNTNHAIAMYMLLNSHDE